MKIEVGQIIECIKAPKSSSFYTVGSHYTVVKVGTLESKVTDDNGDYHLWDTDILDNKDHHTQFKSVD